MIVYGDLSERRGLGAIRAELESLLAEVRGAGGRAPLDSLRSMLIQAGQLEQAAADAPGGIETFLPEICAITDAAAVALLARWSGPAHEGTAHVLDQLASSIHVWDVAATAVERGLDDESERALAGSCGIAADAGVLPAFHRMAYAAFRAGQCHMCAEVCGPDAQERGRLDDAESIYRGRLAREMDRLSR